MKKYLFLIASLFVATGCEKENDGPTPQQLYLAYLTGGDLTSKPKTSTGTSTSSNNGTATSGTAEGVYDPDSNYLKLRLKDDMLKPVNWHLILNDPDYVGEENLVVDLGRDFTNPLGTKVRLTEAQEKALMKGKYYVEAYSDEYPGGVIRGQLVPR
ncbi:CHRD domain-containing protein [Telluribacter sp. SYSU D00476]|uniref:CHRD domain-containing protein n=1 Tax=Telluribacter sp. SYSU D00476 TaxID=2811430 RepID=UPI001FF56970|nr:CHRD domain-containing protein [Telluribacter sp. SYSU D00476]